MASSDHYYSKRYNEEKQIRVYYLPIELHEGGQKYMYVAASSLLHEQFMSALEMKQIPDFAVVVARGDGQPSNDIKQKMKQFYGFDHDAFAADPDTYFNTSNAA